MRSFLVAVVSGEPCRGKVVNHDPDFDLDYKEKRLTCGVADDSWLLANGGGESVWLGG